MVNISLALLTDSADQLVVQPTIGSSRVSSGAKGALWFVWRLKEVDVRAFGGGLRFFTPARLLLSSHLLSFELPLRRPARRSVPGRPLALGLTSMSAAHR
jgi:hypothetical protein